MPVINTPILKLLSDLDIDLMDVNNDEDYLRALMEGVNQLTIINSKDTRIPVLQKEIKRVRARRKEAAPSPAMKAQKKRITGASIKRGGALAVVDKTPQIVTQPVVQQTVVAGGGGEKRTASRGFVEILKRILANVNGMLAVLMARTKFDEKQANIARKRTEKASREKKEEGLESKVFESLKATGERVLRPVKSLWNDLWGFITTIFLGRAAIRLWEWFSNPENQKKLGKIAQSIAEWWPKFLKGTTEFFSQVIDFGKWVAENIGAWTTTLLTTTIPALTAALVGMGPFGVVGAGAVGLTGGVLWNQTQKQKSGDEEESSTTTPASPTITEQTGETIIQEQTGETIIQEQTSETIIQDSSDKIDPFEVLEKNRDLVPLGMYNVALNEIRKDPSAYDTREEIEAALSGLGIDVGRIKYAEGGQVPGRGDRDTVPAMLTPGEFVMSKGAVEKYGADLLARMNAEGGGTNLPGLGGGGLGTNSLTEQAKVKTFASAILGFLSGDDGKRRRATQDNAQRFNGGGLVEVKGSGDGSSGTLRMFDNVGKQVGRLYKIMSGLSGMGDVSQADRRNISGKGYPMPDGNYRLHGFEQHGPLGGKLSGLGDWSSFIGPGSGNIGNRHGLMLHNDVDPFGTLGCIGVGLGGRAGTIQDKEFVKSYMIANPERIKINLGVGTGSKSSRKPSPTADNSTPSSKGTKPGSTSSTTMSSFMSQFMPKDVEPIGDLLQEFSMDSLIQKGMEKKAPVPPPGRPKTTIAYEKEMLAQGGGIVPGSGMSLPQMDPSAMISVAKIETLGMSV